MLEIVGRIYARLCKEEKNDPKTIYQVWIHIHIQLHVHVHIFLCSSTDGVSVLLVCMALRPQITHRHCSKFSLSIWTSQNSMQYSKLIGRFWFITQARWQVAGQLQLHCLSRLNLFIPCVCTFTYLSTSIIFTADTSSSSRPCCSVALAVQSIKCLQL